MAIFLTQNFFGKTHDKVVSSNGSSVTVASYYFHIGKVTVTPG